MAVPRRDGECPDSSGLVPGPPEPLAQRAHPPAEPRPAEWPAATPAPPSQTSSGRGPAEPTAAPSPPRRAGLAEPATLRRRHRSRVALPIANYDDLSLASLRARLRNLDSAQLHALLGYEQAHAARPAVLGMFERRISKLETGQG